MNKDQVEGRWKQFTGTLKEKLGHLAGDDTMRIAGIRERLEGSLLERHCYRKNMAQDDAPTDGLGRWKILDARVNRAFKALRSAVDCDRADGASNGSRSQATRQER